MYVMWKNIHTGKLYINVHGNNRNLRNELAVYATILQFNEYFIKQIHFGQKYSYSHLATDGCIQRISCEYVCNRITIYE